nr:dynamin-related protein 1E isoform X2 [Ipomoea batatas]GMD65173.1 dynamin-related protein 1E isoform X2 [Ipomoea batatas]
MKGRRNMQNLVICHGGDSLISLWFARKFRMKLTESLEKPNKYLRFLSTSASTPPMWSTSH